MNRAKIAIIGLGYVGLPLHNAFSKKFETVGFDINHERIKQLTVGIDVTLEVSSEELHNELIFTNKIEDISNCNIFIITVPTPLDKYKAPDLSYLIEATSMIGSVLKKNDIVIYESTVYPGCTEEDCVPVLESKSKLKYKVDFHCGYSPERINPGDKINTLTKIKKITSGSSEDIAIFVDSLYSAIITAGTFKAKSIKVAEAAKAIENAQRDLNISFMNELALIFDKLEIDTNDVIEAASTKWNFLKFKPGLVGGHCIGVDPYYLAQKANSVGYNPQVILSGRRVNDFMAEFVANKMLKLLVQRNKIINNSKVLILGITFKENCPDIRNSKVIDIVRHLDSFGIKCDVFDPVANKNEVFKEYDINLLQKIDDTSKYDGLLLAVSHSEFNTIDFNKYKLFGTVIFDVKGVLDRNIVDARL